MSNPLLRIFHRSPQRAPADRPTSSADALENAALARLKAQMEELKSAGQLLAEGRAAEFLARLPKLERLETLSPQGQSFGHEFLLEAAGQGSLEVVRALLARDVAASGKGLATRNAGSGNTAVHAAAGQGHREIVYVLLQHGADVNALNAWGETPLHCATARDDLKTMAYLLECGAGIDVCMPGSDTGTPLWRAAGKLSLTGVRFLLEHGADPRRINDVKKQSPAQSAHRGFEEACRQFHRNHGEKRAEIGDRIKQYEILVDLLERAERRMESSA
jgi:ankyrin repeat protein